MAITDEIICIKRAGHFQIPIKVPIFFLLTWSVDNQIPETGEC